MLAGVTPLHFCVLVVAGALAYGGWGSRRRALKLLGFLPLSLAILAAALAVLGVAGQGFLGIAIWLCLGLTLALAVDRHWG